MASDISLSASVRTSLLSLTNSQESISRTQTRLSTGNKLRSAIDGADSYFQAKSLDNRAMDLQSRKDQINQGVSTIGAALNGASSIEGLLKQMKGIVQSAATADSATRETLKNQYNDIRKQIDATAADSSYQGLNLLSGGGKLTVQFGDTASAKLTVESKKLDTSKDSLNLQEISGFGSTTDELGAMSAKLDSAITTVRARASELGQSSASLQTRMDFTKSYVNALQAGSGNLTQAAFNEEGANRLALQTRQQIGVQSLSLANQSQQAVLSLFR